jgi:hypothetical protein
VKPIRIAFDIGGVLSKRPEIWRPLVNILLKNGNSYGIEAFVITDMHDTGAVCRMLEDNGFVIPVNNVHSADFETHGEMCKAVLCKELGIDILIDDFPGYVNDGDHIRLLVMPDTKRPYYATAEKEGDPHWHTDGSEGNFGRRPRPTKGDHPWK